MLSGVNASRGTSVNIQMGVTRLTAGVMTVRVLACACASAAKSSFPSETPITISNTWQHTPVSYQRRKQPAAISISQAAFVATQTARNALASRHTHTINYHDGTARPAPCVWRSYGNFGTTAARSCRVPNPRQPPIRAHLAILTPHQASSSSNGSFIPTPLPPPRHPSRRPALPRRLLRQRGAPSQQQTSAS